MATHSTAGLGGTDIDRLQRVREHVDLVHGRGLEIGGLAIPIVTRAMGSIQYADHATTEELRRKYAADPSVALHDIVSVDFVWGDASLAECCGASAPFDYVVASHVVEHVPDMVGWLHEVAAVLRPGGRLCLVIPDRRVTFDVRRRPTDVADLVDAYLLHRRRPNPRAVFDHFSRHVAVDTAAMWRGDTAYTDTAIDLDAGLAAARQAAETGEYIDAHCWVVSPSEFVDLLADLMRLHLIDFRFAGFTPTPLNDIEFFVALERLDDGLTASEKASLGLESLPAMATMGGPPGVATDGGATAHVPAETLSAREVALVHLKRAVMARARSLGGALLRRAR